MKRIYKQKSSSSPLHLGEILKTHIDTHRVYKSSLARKINRSDSTIGAYQKQKSMQTDIVWELSVALKHNFFADIAALLPADYTQTTPPSTTKDEQIAELELQIKILKAQIEVLR